MGDKPRGGGRVLAEAVQEMGSAPLDALFSKRGYLKKSLERSERFREQLLLEGYPLPPHLQTGSADEPLLLADSLLSDLGEEDEVGASSESEDDDEDTEFLEA